MKPIISHILPIVLLSFQALVVFPTAWAGPFDELVASIGAYVDTNPECPFDEHEKEAIHRELERLSSSVNLFGGRYNVEILSGAFSRIQNPEQRPGATKLLGSISSLCRSAWEEPLVVLQKKAREYFTEWFGRELEPESIRFSPKDVGDQLGCVMHFTVAGQPVTYHIKTHRQGIKNDLTDDAGVLEPYELFGYAFLEASNCGPEAHFFGVDAENFYIATLDAGYPNDGLPEPLPFFTYGQLQEGHPDFFHKKPSQKWHIHPLVKEGLVTADIITRVLGLSDTVTNPGNICFIVDRTGELERFQIIDIALIRQYLNAQCALGGLYSEFVRGVGHSYRLLHEAACRYLSSKSSEKRIAYARSLFTLAEFLQWIDEAEAKALPVVEAMNLAAAEAGAGNVPIDLGRFRRLIGNARRNAEIFFRALGAPEE